MTSIVNHLDLEAKLALIRAHPDLGSKAKMAEAFVQEQSTLFCLTERQKIKMCPSVSFFSANALQLFFERIKDLIQFSL